MALSMKKNTKIKNDKSKKQNSKIAPPQQLPHDTIISTNLSTKYY